MMSGCHARAIKIPRPGSGLAATCQKRGLAVFYHWTTGSFGHPTGLEPATSACPHLIDPRIARNKKPPGPCEPGGDVRLVWRDYCGVVGAAALLVLLLEADGCGVS